jgi:hypothetical protein
MRRSWDDGFSEHHLSMPNLPVTDIAPPGKLSVPTTGRGVIRSCSKNSVVDQAFCPRWLLVHGQIYGCDALSSRTPRMYIHTAMGEVWWERSNASSITPSRTVQIGLPPSWRPTISKREERRQFA